MLEALYEPDLGPEELFETMSQAFLNAVDRDAISGWGVVSYVMYSPQFIANDQYEGSDHQEVLAGANGLVRIA
jgi:20S proteasome alpha/beta subunit